MKLLISTHHLLRNSGTEIYTLTLCRLLSQHGHSITLYSHYFNPKLIKFQNIPNLKLVTSLESIKKQDFDVIHTNHNLNAIELRYVFPNTPIIFQSHGIKPFLEQPPIFNLNIGRYLAISIEAKNNLISQNIDPSKITIFGNLFDDSYFYPTTPLSPKLTKALAFTNYSHPAKDAILLEISRNLGFSLDFLGGIYGEIDNDQLNEKLNQYDLIFTLGRGVVESILSGRQVFIIGNNSYYGYVTPENFHFLSKNNFSNRTRSKNLDLNIIQNKVSKYDPSNTNELITLAKDIYSPKTQLNQLEKIYLDVIVKHKTSKIDQKLLDFIYNSIQTTRDYQDLLNFENNLEYSILKKSKIYSIYHLWQRVKNEWQD